LSLILLLRDVMTA